jgi:hypothetical protein
MGPCVRIARWIGKGKDQVERASPSWIGWSYSSRLVHSSANHRQRRADCGGRGCVGCVQGDGGVVAMLDGAVTFKGGTISRTKAVRTRPFRLHIT